MNVFILFFIYINVFILSNNDYIEFHYQTDFLNLNLKNSQTPWGVFIDTFNDYFTLNDPPNQYDWTSEIINEAEHIIKEDNTIIASYNKKNNATLFSIPVKVDFNKKLIENLKIYYTKEKCNDELVWNYIYDNYRQLACCFCLNVENPKM